MDRSLGMLKRIIVILGVLVLPLSLFACGGEKKETKTVKKESVEVQNEEDAFDGNTIEIVEIDNGVFSKTLSKPFKKDTYSKKEQKNIDRVTAVLNDIDLNADSKILECWNYN